VTSRAPSAPVRLAFVGQRTYFDGCALRAPAGGVEPAFFDFAPDAPTDALLAALQAFAPDVVFAFRPELLPAGLLREVDAVTAGYLTEPLPRPDGASHPDLEARLEVLQAADVQSFDRIVCFDPLIAPTAERVLPVWRSFPIPVADEVFAPVRPAGARPRLLFIGRSTAHRERFLGPLKHSFDLVHLAHGVAGEQLERFFAEADIGVNLHNEPYPTFENRVSLHLAAGHLVLSEPLSPRHALQPAVDYLECAQPWEMWELCSRIGALPDAFHSVRVNGRRQVERFRASRVYPRFVFDLLADVDVFGGRRRGGGAMRGSARTP
jgi:hypothetical protein